MFFLSSANHCDRRSLALKGQSIQRKLLLFNKGDLSSHVITVEDEVSSESEFLHDLSSQFPYGAHLGEDDGSLLVVVAHDDLYVALRRDCALPDEHALAHLEE